MRGIFKSISLVFVVVMATLFLGESVFALAPLNTVKEIDFAYGNGFGASHRMDGDLDGDGIDDIVVGAYRWLNNNDTGKVMIHWGGSTISDSPDITIDGSGVNTRFGDGMGVGDFNGDGIDDLAVGAVEYSAYAGRAYVFYGGTRANWATYSDAGDANVTITGAAGSHLGNKLEIGDIDGDGYGDLLVGAEQHADYGAYLLYGSSSASITKNWNQMDVVFNNDFPFGLSSLGEDVYIADVTGDSYNDVLICAGDWLGEGGDHTGVIVFEGSANAQTTMTGNVNASTANVQIWGHGDYFTYGYGLKAGDINGDGKQDILSGGSMFGVGGTGHLTVFYGDENLSGTKEVATDADIIFSGEVDTDLFGMSLMAGDINNDGIDDIVASANFYPVAWVGPGRLYVFYGSSSLSSTINASDADYVIENPTGIGRIGWWMSVGDIDNDGWDEFASMAVKVANTTTTLYVFSPSHIPPTVALNENSVTSIAAGNTVRFSGTATDSDGGTIQNVQYSYDGTNWLNATADDGAFNGASEYFHFDLTLLVAGSYNIWVRATDSENATTTIANYATTTLTVTSVTAPTVLPETGEVNIISKLISWVLTLF